MAGDEFDVTVTLCTNQRCPGLNTIVAPASEFVAKAFSPEET
jgi:hypothetical protein